MARKSGSKASLKKLTTSTHKGRRAISQNSVSGKLAAPRVLGVPSMTPKGPERY